MTIAPFAASRVAIACPMPRDAPVTRAVLPVSSLTPIHLKLPGVIAKALTAAFGDDVIEPPACLIHRIRWPV